MLHPSEFLISGDGTLYHFSEHEVGSRLESSLEEIDGEVMCYTGLDDSDGTRIYEDDVVQTFNYNAVVKWNTSIAGWVVDVPQSANLSKLTRSFAEDVDLTVIGNRYENPELLNDT